MNETKSPTRKRLPDWLDFKIIAILVTVGVFLFALMLTFPPQQRLRFYGMSSASLTAAQQTPTPTQPVKASRTATKIPAEWLTNRDMSRGIVLGGVVLIIIIIGGTLSAILRK